MPRKIGILVVNTDVSDFAHRHPFDDVKFARLIHAVRPQWQIIGYPVKDGVFPYDVHACDGFVITGSPASVNGKDAWIEELMAFIRQLDAAGVATVGCCFGHQAIAKALGGTVATNPAGWGFGVSPTAFNVFASWMQPALPVLNLYAAHNEQVTVLPPGAEVLGGDAACPYGAFRIGTTFFTTQYHPEITRDFFEGIIEEYGPHVGAGETKRAQAQMETPTDSLIFAEWMARFLEMPRSAKPNPHPPG